MSIKRQVTVFPFQPQGSSISAIFDKNKFPNNILLVSRSKNVTLDGPICVGKYCPLQRATNYHSWHERSIVYQELLLQFVFYLQGAMNCAYIRNSLSTRQGRFVYLICPVHLVNAPIKYSTLLCILMYTIHQSLSSLTLWVRIPLKRGGLDIALCDNVWEWLAAGRWFSPCTPVSSANKTDRHDITEILLKAALNTTSICPYPLYLFLDSHSYIYSWILIVIFLSYI